MQIMNTTCNIHADKQQRNQNWGVKATLGSDMPAVYFASIRGTSNLELGAGIR